MTLAISIASLVLAVIAAVIALWQGLMSRDQLRLAESTKSETDRTLAEIREQVKENKQITESIKSDIDQRINRILDLRLENERRDSEMSNRMAEGLISGVGNFFGKALEAGLQEQANDPAQKDEPED